MKNGVNSKLLLVEYCNECRKNNEESLMYSRFCNYIQVDEEKRRASMHIPRKPGEQLEVSCAGDSASIMNSETGRKQGYSVTPLKVQKLLLYFSPRTIQ